MDEETEAGTSKLKEPTTDWWKDKKAIAKIIAIIAIGGSIFHLYVAGFGFHSEVGLRSIHWTIISVLVFIAFPLGKGKNKALRAIDMLFLLCALVCGIYQYIEWPIVIDNAGFIMPRDIIFGVIMIIVVLEASRRVVGWPMTIVALVFLAYAFFGQYLPGRFATKGFSTEWIINVLYMSPDGIYGMPLGVSASYIVLFVLFGSFLQVTGGGKLFTDLAFALVGRAFGGPAKAAVVSSGLMGMLSGSAAANVATVGTFTIPLMKKSGYPSKVAGAIEACSSTGGQFMPPVMGAAAFIMAENLGISYGKVCLAAILPALLFYFYLYVNVDLEARKSHIEKIKPEDIPSIKVTLKERGHLLLPLFALIALMCFGFSPGKSVFWSIIFLVITAMLRKTTRVGLKDLFKALEDGIIGTIPIAVACAAAGIIGSVISLTGLGLSFSSILISLAGNSILLLLILTMVASLILGMGLPTTACYVILAILTAPALTSMGASPLASHFFIFFFGCVSTITPPVALSAYCAAGIAKSNPMSTGYTAFRMGLVAFIIPFIAFFSPSLLFEGSLASTAFVTVTAIFLLFSLAFATAGQGFKRKLNWFERIVFFAAGCLFIIPHNYITFGIGCLVFAVGFILERLKKSTDVQGKTV